MIYFVTSNPHKFKQAEKIFDEYNIRIKRVGRSYDEASDDTVRQIVEKAARKLADELNKTVVVEDTGVFFHAYPGFPGALPKFVFNRIGYAGLFRLLKGRSKKARFVSCVGYCSPGKRPKVFAGEMKGRIQLKVCCRNKKVLPYERIFIPLSFDKVMAKLSLEEKLRILHRAKALRKLAGYLS